jgi:hypothetical protein
MQDEEDD